jgi:predicted nucleotidyltransferase
LPDQIDDVVRLVREVLSANDLVGVYLHGSAVLGGLRPHSDVDVFAVSRRHTTERERRALVEGLLGISGDGARSGSARPVELTVVVHSEVRPWRYPPRREFQYGEWMRDEFERGRIPSPIPDPDLAPLITMVLLGNYPLFGPRPEEVFDPVPREDVFRTMREGVPELLAGIEEDTRNAILTLSRIWTTFDTGEIKSKDAAAEWALPRLPEEHKPPLARARSIYLGEEEERWDDLILRIRPHAEYVSERITNLSDNVI